VVVKVSTPARYLLAEMTQTRKEGNGNRRGPIHHVTPPVQASMSTGGSAWSAGILDNIGSGRASVFLRSNTPPEHTNYECGMVVFIDDAEPLKTDSAWSRYERGIQTTSETPILTANIRSWAPSHSHNQSVHGFPMHWSDRLILQVKRPQENWEAQCAEMAQATGVQCDQQHNLPWRRNSPPVPCHRTSWMQGSQISMPCSQPAVCL